MELGTISPAVVRALGVDPEGYTLCVVHARVDGTGSLELTSDADERNLATGVRYLDRRQLAAARLAGGL